MKITQEGNAFRLKAQTEDELWNCWEFVFPRLKSFDADCTYIYKEREIFITPPEDGVHIVKAILHAKWPQEPEKKAAKVGGLSAAEKVKDALLTIIHSDLGLIETGMKEFLNSGGTIEDLDRMVSNNMMGVKGNLIYPYYRIAQSGVEERPKAWEGEKYPATPEMCLPPEDNTAQQLKDGINLCKLKVSQQDEEITALKDQSTRFAQSLRSDAETIRQLKKRIAELENKPSSKTWEVVYEGCFVVGTPTPPDGFRIAGHNEAIETSGFMFHDKEIWRTGSNRYGYTVGTRFCVPINPIKENTAK